MSAAIGRYLTNAKFILLRLPSLVVADYILLNSEAITSKIMAPSVVPGSTLLSEANHLQYLVSYVLAKFAVLMPLIICALVFTLNKIYVWRIYKIVVLISLPFVFRHFVDIVYNNDQFIFGRLVSKTLLIVFIYCQIATLTILIYNDVYRNFIIDKHKIYSYYHLHRNRGNEVLTNFIDILSNQANINNSGSSSDELYSNLDSETEKPISLSPHHHEMRTVYDFDSIISAILSLFRFLNAHKRALYIISYSIASFYLNEIPILENHNQNIPEKPLNIMSLGYLFLLTYDLANNFEQILLRVLIQLKLLGRLINQYGLNNFLSFNWFERLKVPYFLRLYFFLKLTVFTVNFIQNKQYYLQYDVIISKENNTDLFSLYNYIIEWLNTTQHQRASNRLMFDTKGSETEKTKFEFDSFISQLLNVFIPSLNDLPDEKIVVDESLTNLSVVYIRFLILNLSNTLIAVACTTSILSYQFYLLGIFVNKVTGQVSLANQNNNNARRNDLGGVVNIPEGDLSNVGDVAAVLFFLLSVQSGLTYLSRLQRVEKLLKNYSLLFIAILHYFHTSIDTQLMALSASSKSNWRTRRHLRVLCVAFSLIFLPLLILVGLWTNFEVSTWLLAASAFNIELIVKSGVSLILYWLFLIDSKRLTSAYDKMKKNDNSNDDDNNDVLDSFDQLDEYIYSVKAVGHSFEFITAIFLFFNGAYILLFESYGIIRVVMMVIHAYFHIWCQAIKGWAVFVRRRTAKSKLKRLTRFDCEAYKSRVRPSATLTRQSQVEIESEFKEKMRDVCAICFCELGAHESVITQCNHLFHTACLRKWLYLQDTCPMCHQIVYDQ